MPVITSVQLMAFEVFLMSHRKELNYLNIWPSFG